jgi:SH3-like domain-containing protein
MVQKNLRSKLFFLISLFFPLISLSQTYEKKNYFASTRASKVNVRSGPNLNYQIKYVLNQKFIPIKIIGEFDNWLEIADYEGEEGWVNKNLITKKRTAIIKTAESFVYIYKKNSLDSKKVAKIENLAIIDFINCKDFWCKIEHKSTSGWVNQENLWGY